MQVRPVHPHRPQIQVSRAAGEGGAAGAADAAQRVHGRDEGADKAQVDEGDEEARAAGARVGDERRERPRRRQHGHDERDEDVVGGEDVVGDEAVHEVGEHADDGDQRDQLGEPPEDEEDAGEGHCAGGGGGG